MAHLITWEPKGVYAKFVGTCDFDDVRQAYEKFSVNSQPDDIRYANFGAPGNSLD